MVMVVGGDISIVVVVVGGDISIVMVENQSPENLLKNACKEDDCSDEMIDEQILKSYVGSVLDVEPMLKL